MPVIAAQRNTIIGISNPNPLLSISLGSIWGITHIPPNVQILWDVFGKVPISFSIDPKVRKIASKINLICFSKMEKLGWSLSTMHALLIPRMEAILRSEYNCDDVN
ncbi:hypothetical protein F8E02_01520 [Methanoculleus sp. Wushi-C6]|uniref:Uncharacterized protein n=1 Tax=Methanoculleus caldifontis TaxID=2651577 RepID=A0ABU3WYA1_9EURY|nr:hypothetical protein [Methanoculleus sp. Wushi-C6]